MQMSVRSIVAAGCAILAAAAVTPALAGDGQVHVLTIPLPGGGVEQIRYTGDDTPRVVIAPSGVLPSGVAGAMSFDPFSTIERISAMMDQQAAAMLRQMDDMTRVTIPDVPQGSSGYSFVSTMSGRGVCSRSVRITFSSGDAAPKMISSTSGDCGPDHSGSAPTEVDQPAPAPRPANPHTIEVKAGTTPTQVAWNR